MAISKRQKSVPMEIWPGFVDVLATLLIVIIFLLMIFLLSQIFLNDALIGRDKELDSLNARLTKLTAQLNIAQENKDNLQQQLLSLQSDYKASLLQNQKLGASLSQRNTAYIDLQQQLKQSQQDNTILNKDYQQQSQQLINLQKQITDYQLLKEKLEKQLLTANADLLSLQEDLTKTETENDSLLSEKQNLEILSEKERKKLLAAQAQLAAMEDAADALQAQIQELNRLLSLSEERDRKAKVQIVELGKKLNTALASKVQQLARYRSDFFGKLRDILGSRRNVKIVGDRFVFQSEVLFDPGSDILAENGQQQIKELATTFLDLTQEIPDDIDWILRIDGHTDKRPISNNRFPSNWELSTARAVAVTKFLINQGLPPQRLAATGFGEFQPLDNTDNDTAYHRNRRIEFKLTTR